MDFALDMENRVRNVVVAIMGDQKVGKTTLASSFPKPALLDLEGGAEYIKVPKLRVIDIMEKEQTTLYHVFSEFRGYLVDNKDIETVIIDTADAMWSLLAAPKITANGTLPINQYNPLYKQYMDLLRGFKEVGKDVVLTSHIKHSHGEDGAIVKTDFALPEKLAKNLGGFVDEVFYMAVGTREKQVNKRTVHEDCRTLLTKPVQHPRFGLIPAGDRSGNLPKIIYNATYKDLKDMKKPPKFMFDGDAVRAL